MRNLVSILMKKGRNFALGASLVGALAACGENPVTREMCVSNNFKDVENAELITCEKKNQAPTLEIGVGFGDGLTGKVTYLVTGTDPDGTVSELRARYNGGAWEIYSNGTSFQKDIIPGTNSLEAYAVDDKGAQSQIVTRSFVSPTEEEARGVIDERLNTLPNGGITKDSNYTAPQDGINAIMADYAVEPLPSVPSGDVIIEYVSSTDDLTQELNDKQYLDSYGVPNLYLGRLPISEIESRLNAWIDNGFK